MASDKKQSRKNPDETSGEGKVGSDRAAARNVGGKGDFGIPAPQAVPHDMRPHDKAKPPVDDQADDHRAISGKAPGQRTHGVGSAERGKPGSGSGGDVDTDFIGAGTGGSSVAASGDINEPPGPDDTDGSSNAFASGPPAKGEGNLPRRGMMGGSVRVKGSVHDKGDRADGIGGPPTNSGASPQGADATGNAEAGGPGDDASAGEISAGEAGGQGG